MRAVRLFLGVSAASAVIAAIASGCGGSTNGAAPIDSGTAEDVTMEAAPMMEAAVESAAPEAAPPEASVVDAACVPDASLSSIAIPDSGLADSGINVGACISCFTTEPNCAPVVSSCNENCACISAVQGFAACIGMPGGSLLSCAAGLTAIPGVTTTELETCGITCATACGITLPGGDSGTTGDSGTGDSGSATDAPTGG
jgi:hypothetical protein